MPKADVAAPPGFKGAYERAVRHPASPRVLADILSLVGYDVEPETIERWTLQKRVEVEVWACREHLVASDNPLRRHPRPSWLPEPWKGDDLGSFCASSPTRLEV